MHKQVLDQRQKAAVNTKIVSSTKIVSGTNSGVSITPTRSRRGASFSAQSGANYAINIPEFNDIYPQSDNVEFSTPQFLPSSLDNEMTWLNNIPNIPGLSDSVSAANLMRQNSITNSADHVTPPVNVSQHGSFSHQSTFSATDMGQTRSESVNSLNTPFDGSYMMPTVTISNQEIQNGVAAHHHHQQQQQHQQHNHQHQPNQSLLGLSRNDMLSEDHYGYSFYDIPGRIFSISQWILYQQLQMQCLRAQFKTLNHYRLSHKKLNMRLLQELMEELGISKITTIPMIIRFTKISIMT